MRRPKAERLIKAVRVAAPRVGGQLDEAATALAALLDGPFEHRRAEAAAALAGSDAHAFDLAAPHAAVGQAGNKAELQHADEAAAAFGHRKKLVRVPPDCGEGFAIADIQRQAG